MKAETGMQSTVRGDVYPLVGRGEGRVVVVDGDVEYRVVAKGAGVDLADHLGEQVEAMGTVSQDDEGIMRILIRSYRLIDGFDDEPWYDDERG